MTRKSLKIPDNSKIRAFFDNKNEKGKNNKIELNLIGYGEFSISDKGEYIPSNGGVLVKVSYEINGHRNLLVWDLPFNFIYNVGLNAEADLNLQDIIRCNGYLLKVGGKISAGIGAGHSEILYADIFGDVDAALTLNMFNIKNINPFNEFDLSAKDQT